MLLGSFAGAVVLGLWDGWEGRGWKGGLFSLASGLGGEGMTGEGMTGGAVRDGGGEGFGPYWRCGLRWFWGGGGYTISFSMHASCVLSLNFIVPGGGRVFSPRLLGFWFGGGRGWEKACWC